MTNEQTHLLKQALGCGLKPYKSLYTDHELIFFAKHLSDMHNSRKSLGFYLISSSFVPTVCSLLLRTFYRLYERQQLICKITKLKVKSPKVLKQKAAVRKRRKMYLKLIDIYSCFSFLQVGSKAALQKMHLITHKHPKKHTLQRQTCMSDSGLVKTNKSN